jgi:DNA-binding PadR family transcriptional regulator
MTPDDPTFAEVLALLTDRWQTGRDVRARLNAGRWWWRKWSGPAFYALMARMEDAGLVERAVEGVVVEGQVVAAHSFRRTCR